jgi:hypothetical protein
LGFKSVFKNATDQDLQFQNMPMVDFRLRRMVPEPLAAQQYYSTVTLEAEIAHYEMTDRDKCATIRDDLTAALQRWLQENPHFSAFSDTVLVGPVEFEVGETKAQGEFVAAAVATFLIMGYSDR